MTQDANSSADASDEPDRRSLLKEVTILSRDVARLRQTATRLSTEMMPLAKAKRRWALLMIFALITTPVLVVVLLFFSATQQNLDDTVSEFRGETASACERRNVATQKQVVYGQNLRAFIMELKEAEKVSTDNPESSALRDKAFADFLAQLDTPSPAAVVDCSVFTR